jgi:hypothetical protein
MQYMLLIYGTPTVTPDDKDLGPEQITDWRDVGKALEAEGVVRGGDGLQGVETATTVRVRGGERLVTDGPFAETKEHLLGYYLIDVPDLDKALDWAARMPNVHWGSVEVRPVLGMGSGG